MEKGRQSAFTSHPCPQASRALIIIVIILTFISPEEISLRLEMSVSRASLPRRAAAQRTGSRQNCRQLHENTRITKAFIHYSSQVIISRIRKGQFESAETNGELTRVCVCASNLNGFKINLYVNISVFSCEDSAP